MSRLIVEVELLDANATWSEAELPDLAERFRAALMWHAIPQDLFTKVGDVTARKG